MLKADELEQQRHRSQLEVSLAMRARLTEQSVSVNGLYLLRPGFAKQPETAHAHVSYSHKTGCRCHGIGAVWYISQQHASPSIITSLPMMPLMPRDAYLWRMSYMVHKPTACIAFNHHITTNDAIDANHGSCTGPRQKLAAIGDGPDKLWVLAHVRTSSQDHTWP